MAKSGVQDAVPGDRYREAAVALSSTPEESRVPN